MPTENYDIVGSYNNQRIMSIDAERSVNMFEYVDALGKKPKSLINTSGLVNTDFEFPGAGATDGFRAQFVFKNRIYNVVGQRVYYIDNTFALVQIGTLGTPTGYVGIDANETQVIFVDGQLGYIYDTITGMFTQITDPSFPVSPLDVCFLDGFFIVPHGGTNDFQLSEFNQGLIWGPDNTGTPNTFTLAALSSDLTLTAGTTAFYQVGTPVTISGSTIVEIPNGDYFVVSISAPTIIRVSTTLGGAAISSVAGGGGSLTNNGQLQLGEITSHPGTIVACRTLHRRLFLFSQNFTEVWENQGIGTNLPFRRNNSLLIEYGTVGVGSIAVGFDKMFFLSQDRDGLGAVMEVIGAQAVPISNRALDFQFAQYAAAQQITANDPRCFLIKENGLIFYRMNFTLADHTYVYNVTLSNPAQEETRLWHEEETLRYNRHPSQTHAYFNGINYVGSYNSPVMYVVDSGSYTNDGENIRRMRIGRPVVPPGYQRMRIDRFQLDLLQGIGDQPVDFETLDLLTENELQILTEAGIPITTDQLFDTETHFDLGVFLSLSKDGGRSYYATLEAPMGRIGERSFRTLWRKLGTVPRGQAFVPKIEFFQNSPFVILGASWSFDVLPE